MPVSDYAAYYKTRYNHKCVCVCERETSPVDGGCWVENEVLRIPCSQTIRNLDHPLTGPQTVRNRDHLLTGLVGICS